MGINRTGYNCIVLNYIVSLHLYSASCSARESEALPVREIQREESSIERTTRGIMLGWQTAKAESGQFLNGQFKTKPRAALSYS